jgi:hypothetical protein
MSVRAIVCKGSFLERFSRACRAASFEELKAASRGGDGYFWFELLGGPSSSSSPSSSIRSSDRAAAEEENRMRGGNEACCCRRQHSLVLVRGDRAVSNCPLHLSSRNLFICDIDLILFCSTDGTWISWGLVWWCCFLAFVPLPKISQACSDAPPAL